MLREFPRYFSIKPALTRADLQKTFQIRYRVYCEEFGYEPAANFPDRMEHEDLDEVATHCLITHRQTDMPAGCVRMVPGSRNGVRQVLPLERCCSASLQPEAIERLNGDRDLVCEASRFAVDGAFRRRSGESVTRFGEISALNLSDAEQRTFPLLSAALMLAGTALAERLENPCMFALMEPFLPRLLRRSGMIFNRMGGDVDHHGIRAAYLCDTREFVRDMAGELRDLYWWIHGELQGVVPTSVAVAARAAPVVPRAGRRRGLGMPKPAAGT